MNPHTKLPTSPLAATNLIWQQRNLLFQLTWRAVRQRYPASVLGVLWSLVSPLLMLTIYTLVFSKVFKFRWGGADDSTGMFAVILFVGTSLHGLLADVANRAPGLIAEHASYVKKVVFPVELLPVVTLLSALFQCVLNLSIVLLAVAWTNGRLSWHVLQLPLVLAPFVLLLLGFAWFISALGVFVRDLLPVTALVTTGLLFLSPVFYPADAVPERLRFWMQLNPLTFVIEQARGSLIWAQPLNVQGLLIYTLSACLVAWLGFFWFQKTRKGFADVL